MACLIPRLKSKFSVSECSLHFKWNSYPFTPMFSTRIAMSKFGFHPWNYMGQADRLPNQISENLLCNVRFYWHKIPLIRFCWYYTDVASYNIYFSGLFGPFMVRVLGYKNIIIIGSMMISTGLAARAFAKNIIVLYPCFAILTWYVF